LAKKGHFGEKGEAILEAILGKLLSEHTLVVTTT